MTETTAEQAAVLKVEHGSIFEALAAAQAEFKAPTKTKKAAYGMYADLAEILAAVRPASMRTAFISSRRSQATA